MRRIKNYLIVFEVTGFLFGLIQVTTAQPGYGKGLNKPGVQGKGYGPQQGQCQWIPDLTEEQQEQIKELRTAHLKEVQSLRSEMMINKAKMNALMIEDDPDLDQINKLIEETGAIQIEMRKNAAAHKLEVLELLTDEQKVVMDSRTGRSKGNFHGQNFRQRGPGQCGFRGR